MKYIKTFEEKERDYSYMRNPKPKRYNEDIKEFLSDKEFTNKKSKMFIYHGTATKPDDFNLRDDYDGEDSHAWSGELPPGHLFLTTELKEASSYGKYVIPCELKRYDHKYFEVDTDNPSRAFDMDYGIDLYMPDDYHDFWGKYEESGKAALIIKGYDKKWTIITNIDNVIPRIDLANEFYNTDENDEVNEGNNYDPNSLLVPQDEVIKRIQDLNTSYQDGTLKITHKQYLRRFNNLKNINTITNQIKRFGARVTRVKGYRGVYQYNGKNFTVQLSEDCCETCWWEVSIWEDNVDKRVQDHFDDYNQYDTKGDVLQALLGLDIQLSK